MVRLFSFYMIVVGLFLERLKIDGGCRGVVLFTEIGAESPWCPHRGMNVPSPFMIFVAISMSKRYNQYKKIEKFFDIFEREWIL